MASCALIGMCCFHGAGVLDQAGIAILVPARCPRFAPPTRSARHTPLQPSVCDARRIRRRCGPRRRAAHPLSSPKRDLLETACYRGCCRPRPARRKSPPWPAPHHPPRVAAPPPPPRAQQEEAPHPPAQSLLVPRPWRPSAPDHARLFGLLSVDWPGHGLRGADCFCGGRRPLLRPRLVIIC